MSKFSTLVKNEFLSNMSRNKEDGLFSRIRKAVITILGGGLLVTIFVYAIYVLMKVFIAENLQHEFIILFSLIIMLAIFVIGLSMATKIFFLKVNLSILKLPVSGEEIFFSKFIYIFTKLFFYTFVLSLPVFIIFGIKTGAGVGYYLMLLPNILFLPVIPFLLSILFSVPAMWLTKIFRNKFIIMLIAYTIVVIAGFAFYIVALKFILSLLEYGDVSNVFNASTLYSIRQASSYMYLSVLFKNCLLLYDYLNSALLCLSITLILVAIVVIYAKKCYLNLIFSSTNLHSFEKKTKVVHQSASAALFSKEFKNIFRSSNYSFQYLTIIITTPLMVFFSSEIASSVGTPILGKGILPGIAVLVLIMFLSMGTSFSATSITREGKNFFLTKIIPVKFTKQILVKFAIYLIISIPAIFISCFILAIADFISYLYAFGIAAALSFVVVGNICNSILTDIKRPQFYYLENGEVTTNNKNISSSISIGFAIAVVMGVGGIVVSFLVSLPAIFLVLFGFGVPYCAIECIRLFFRLEKRYSAIEV